MITNVINISSFSCHNCSTIKRSATSYLVNLHKGKRSSLIFKFDTVVSKNDFITFEFSSPSSDLLYPDILNGDRGFPTLLLTNSDGCIFYFARGNLKDFFNITTPNIAQLVKIPLSAFVYSIFHTTNKPLQGDFFSKNLTRLEFDFVADADQNIDILVSSIDFKSDEKDTLLEATELIYMQRLQNASYEKFGSVEKYIYLVFSLNTAGISQGFNDYTFCVSLWSDGTLITKHSTVLSTGTYSPGPLLLEDIGPYILQISFEKDNVIYAISRIPLCRTIESITNSTPLLGISDEFMHDSISRIGAGSHRYVATLDAKCGNFFPPFQGLLPKENTFRIASVHSMPRHLSSNAGSQYSCYAPSSWKDYSKFISNVLTDAFNCGVTHFEVWNEASAFGSWNDSFENLLMLHKVTYEVAKTNFPTIKVLGGNTHTWDFEFIDNFFNSGGIDYCDGLAIHGYTYKPSNYINDFDKLELIFKKSCTHKPDFKVYITELGFRYPAFDLHQQSMYLFLYTLESACRDFIATILWFRYRNARVEYRTGYQQRASFGYAMAGHNDSYARPSLATFKFTAWLLSHIDTVCSEIISATSCITIYSLFKSQQLKGIVYVNTMNHLNHPSEWIEFNIYGGKLRNMNETVKIFLDKDILPC